MLLINTTVKKSNIHGNGLFTLEDIKKGQIVWKFDPIFDKIWSISQVDGFPEHIKNFIYTYGWLDKEDKNNWRLSVDNERFVNHSDNPNLNTLNSDCFCAIANIDIKNGTELTQNYNEFDYNLRKM